jgi:hypothetical protein
MIVNKEFERGRNEGAVTCFQALSMYISGEYEEDYEKPQKVSISAGDSN